MEVVVTADQKKKKTVCGEGDRRKGCFRKFFVLNI